MTDKEILESIYQDAVHGVTLLIDTYADLVYKIVYEVLSGVGSQDDIEDCVSDSFVAFYDNIDDVDLSRGSIKGFLGVIARRRALNLRYTLNPDDESDFDEYTVEEMSDALEDEEVPKSPGLSDIIIRLCFKEIAPEALEEETVYEAESETETETEAEYETQTEAQDEYEDESEEKIEYEAEEETIVKPVTIIEKKKRSAFGRVLRTGVAMVSLVGVIVAGVIAYNELSVPKYVPPTTQPTTQSSSFNPLFSAISSGNEKLIEQLITNSLLLSQDVLKFAIEYADRISYDSIRHIAEQVRNRYGSTGLDPIIEDAIFGDFQSVRDALENKAESEMTPAEKLAYYFVTTFGG